MSFELIAIWSRIISTVVFFAVLYWIFVTYLKPALNGAQAARNERIAGAERRREAALARAEVARRELASADADIIGIVGRAEEQARHERTKLLAEAEEIGKRLVHNAEGELERARYAARRQIQTELIEKALDKAQRDAEGKVDASFNAQLVDTFVGQLERGARN